MSNFKLCCCDRRNQTFNRLGAIRKLSRQACHLAGSFHDVAHETRFESLGAFYYRGLRPLPLALVTSATLRDLCFL
jgi:hypothetical protein